MRIFTQLTKQRQPLNIKDIEEEYSIDYTDIFNQDSELYRKLIWILNTELTPQEKNILLYYSESQRQKDVAKALGVSTATVNCVIGLLRRKIIEKFNNIKDVEI